MTSNCFFQTHIKTLDTITLPYQVYKRMLCPTGTLLFQLNEFLVSVSRGRKIKKSAKL